MERLGSLMAKFFLISSLLFSFSSISAQAITSEYFNSTKHPLVVEFGFEYLHPTFGSIDNVVIRNPQTSSEAATVLGAVNQTYPDVFAQTLKAKILLDEEKNAELTVQSFLPLNALTQVDTGNTYLPEYVLYRTEKQRPRLSILGEMNISDRFKVGAGLDLGFGVTTEATVFLQSGDGKYSNQRISASVKPRIIPMVVLVYEQYRFLIKGENKVAFTLNASAGANVFPPLNASFDITYAATSALFYDPWIFDLSRRYQLAAIGLNTWSVGIGLSYQLWTGYEQRAAVIKNISGTFSNGLSPAFKARNLLVPRVAIEKSFTRQRWELGYEFKDSIFINTPSSNGNYLDPPRHSFSLGAIFSFSSGWELGTSLLVSRLVPQSVVKLDSTEIGAPGYQASGWLYGGNINLTIPLRGAEKNEFTKN
jgi:hypothetical protein